MEKVLPIQTVPTSYHDASPVRSSVLARCACKYSDAIHDASLATMDSSTGASACPPWCRCACRIAGRAPVLSAEAGLSAVRPLGMRPFHW